MYRERLVATEARSESARRLQQLLLDYHDFRRLKAEHPLMEHAVSVADWVISATFFVSGGMKLQKGV